MAMYDPIKDEPHDTEASTSGYTASQVTAAWKLMTRGDREGLRKRDIERIIRTFRPTTTAAEFEHIIGPLKGRITFSEVKGILMSDSIPKDFDPVLAAFRIFDRDHSSSLSPDELKSFVSQLPEVGQLSKEDMHVMMDLVDADRDGICSFNDFRTFVYKHLERSSTKGPTAQ
eukprot:jgi/Ulvmu1/9069/UM005_0162.1